MPEQSNNTAWSWIFLSWLLVTISTLGAIFFGEIMGYTPCVLCWYQRIAMFPLVLILALGLFPFDLRVVRYALPLAVIGWGFAVFHQGVIAGWIPENLKPCQIGVPCSEVAVVWLGFITIPLLSVVAFTLLVMMLLIASYKGRT